MMLSCELWHRHDVVGIVNWYVGVTYPTDRKSVV